MTDVLEIHIIELPKIKKLIKSESIYRNKELELWIKFLLTPDELEVEELKKSSAIKKAKSELDKLRQDKREERLAELRDKYIRDENAAKSYALKEGLERGMRQGIKQGMKQGMEQGMKQGIKQEKIDIARNMLKENIDIELIMKITRLTKEEIEKLR